MSPVHVTVLLFAIVLSAKLHVPLAVTLSPLTGVAKPIVHVALVPPSYCLLLQLLILGVNDFFVMEAALALLALAALN